MAEAFPNDNMTDTPEPLMSGELLDACTQCECRAVEPEAD
jgi:hypothetical protein